MSSISNTAALTLPSATVQLQSPLALPGSKSLTNRALLMAALAKGPSRLTGALDADDTRAMRCALQTLGLRISGNAGFLTVIGGGGEFPIKRADVNCQDAGTVARFLLPVLAITATGLPTGNARGHYTLSGSATLARRPYQPLLACLAHLGIRPATTRGGLPMHLSGEQGLTPAASPLRLDARLSSQFLSALLIALPLLPWTTHLLVQLAASQPYVDMTRCLQAHFGVHSHRQGDCFVIPGGQRYQPRHYTIPGDLSTASYFLAAALLLQQPLRLQPLSLEQCWQGDSAIVPLLQSMGACITSGDDWLDIAGSGALSGGVFNLQACSDLFMTLAVLAPFASSPVTLTGLAHVRHQESDRLVAVAENLQRLQVRTERGDDYITIYPGPVRGAALPCYGDHRIAMAFAVLGLKVPEITLLEPACVSKTCPDFFNLLGIKHYVA